jgi:hypothetical protein
LSRIGLVWLLIRSNNIHKKIYSNFLIRLLLLSHFLRFVIFVKVKAALFIF